MAPQFGHIRNLNNRTIKLGVLSVE